MIRYLHILFCAMLSLVVLTSCDRPTPSSPRPTVQDFTLCEIQPHGHYYDSIASAVVQLELYSQGLILDSTHHIQGTGYNLCLTDIFVSDSMLEEGTYYSATTGESHTLLPGRDYEGTPHGAYLLQIEDNHIASIRTLDSVCMVVSADSIIVNTWYHEPGIRTPHTYNARYVGQPTYYKP